MEEKHITEKNIMTQANIETIDGAESLAQQTGLDFEVAMNIISIVERRTKLSGKSLALVKISDWLAEQHQDEHGFSSEYLLVEEVEDYSQNSWLVEGAVHVTHEGLSDSDAPLSVALETLNHSTQEYPRDKGTTWVPKSQTENLFAIDA
ncbi:hypothetical protein M1M34_gp098 [Haloarcula tailed virus 2]|uniref:Uncharacterized protein n=1 Tax=Haloarcula tailed virus 2 TaxID=2877989 RepID=A0AAE8XYZ5_9CAUD|nr:hypothetical protein M1M34_gp098 [Haloarcula tailed virus 2]UBF23235.1 hypothetical protein HATV-2_gp84 [Haloarcula tailed virus 2]